MTIHPELFRHYKNNLYKRLGHVHHSETQEELTLYEALKPSDLGPLWVRPRQMFEDEVCIDGITKPRFEQVAPSIEHFSEMSDEHYLEASTLLDRVFVGGYNVEDLKKKIAGKEVLYSRATLGKDFVGFKLGYQIEKATFYSALGAVQPESQSLGFARQVLEGQHQRLQKDGFQKVTTKTKNKWPRMLILNIKAGFQITGTETRANGEIKICMDKAL